MPREAPILPLKRDLIREGYLSLDKGILCYISPINKKETTRKSVYIVPKGWPKFA